MSVSPAHRRTVNARLLLALKSSTPGAVTGLDGRGGVGGEEQGPADAPCTAPGSQWESEARPALRF